MVVGSFVVVSDKIFFALLLVVLWKVSAFLVVGEKWLQRPNKKAYLVEASLKCDEGEKLKTKIER